ncbi:RNA-directed DNA polymerase, eukaryota, reverse transcriptase zinc-binding domain protein [Tanacetum coccineum]
MRVNVAFAASTLDIGSTRSINIGDESDTSSAGDENEIEKDADSSDANSDDGLEDVIKNLNNAKEDEESNVGSPKTNVEDSQIAKEANASDLSCPPGFEQLKRESSRRCSTSFSKCRNKDIKVWLVVAGKNTVGDCYMVSIYGPHDPLAKSVLWNRIRNFMQSNRGKYIVFGDMNEVRNSQECYGSIFSRSEGEVFNTFINSTNLIDLPMGGHSFTWMNKQGTKLSKLDRFLISKEVLNLLLDIRITALDRMWSDHIPILLHCNKRDFGLVPFKVYHSWFNHEGFDELINSKVSYFSFLSSHEKLKALKPNIRLWYATLRSNEISQKQDAMKALKTLENKIEDGYASIEDRDSRIKLLHEIDKLVSFEAMDSI